MSAQPWVARYAPSHQSTKLCGEFPAQGRPIATYAGTDTTGALLDSTEYDGMGRRTATTYPAAGGLPAEKVTTAWAAAPTAIPPKGWLAGPWTSSRPSGQRSPMRPCADCRHGPGIRRSLRYHVSGSLAGAVRAMGAGEWGIIPAKGGMMTVIRERRSARDDAPPTAPHRACGEPESGLRARGGRGVAGWGVDAKG
ncbi:MAG TPA: hypothetical protein VI248_11110 [Kineosporiaceae bacterium]